MPHKYREINMRKLSSLLLLIVALIVSPMGDTVAQSTVTDRIAGVSTALAVKAPVRAATTANITLSGLQTIDGVALATGDRVLVKNQTTATENGIYQANTSSWTRALDFDGNRDVAKGTQVMVTDGTTNASTYWRVSASNPITIGTTSIAFEHATVTDAATVSWIQSGTGAVIETVQQGFRHLPFVNLLDFMSEADRASLLAGTQTDVTTALTNAAATKKKIVCPKGIYQISSPVSIEADIECAGAGNASGVGALSKFVLTGTGQLLAENQMLNWSGIYLTSSVNSLTFVKVTASYFRFHNFAIVGSGTGQVGIELDTMQGAVAGAEAHFDFDNFLISFSGANSVGFNTTDTSFVSNSKFGSRNASWQGFTNAVQVNNTGGFIENHIGGYFETSVNNSNIIAVGAGATYSRNMFDGAIDGSGGASVRAINNSGTVGINTWLGVAPEAWVENGTITTPQVFSHRVKARAYLSADQTGVADNTATKVAFNTKTFDTGSAAGAGAFNTTDNRFVAGRAMYVRVSAKANIGGNLAAGDPVVIYIYKNNAEVSRHTAYFESAAPDLAITDFLLLAATDYVEIFMLANGSGTHVIGGGSLFTNILIEEL